MSESVDTQFNFSGFNTLKKDLRDATILYQQMVASGKASAEQIKQQAARVAELKDKIDDTNDAVKAMTGAGQFQAFGRAISAAAGGFAALQGTIALVGGESEDLQKTMVKLQAALSISQGLSQLEDLGNAFGNLKKVAVNAFNAIKTAIGSTGIGLLVVALGAIVAYWDDITELVSGVSAEQKQLNAETEANLNLNQKNLAVLEENENVLKLSGKSEEEIYDMKLKQYETTIDTAKAQIQNLRKTQEIQVETAKRNKEILQGLIRLVSIPITATLKGIDLIAERLGQTLNLEEKFSGGLASLVFDPEETKKKSDETIEEAEKGLRVLENKLAGMKLQKQEKQKTEAAQEKEKRKKEGEEQEKEAKELAEKISKLRKEETLKREDELTRELEKIDDAYEEKFQLAKGDAELTAQLTESLRNERLAKIKEFDDKELQAKQELLQKEEEAEKEAQRQAEERRKTEYEQALQNSRDFYTKKETQLLEALQKGLITEEEFATKSKEISLEKSEAELVIAEDYGEKTLDLRKEIAEKEVAIAQGTAEKKRAISLKVVEETLQLGQDLVSALSELDKISTEQQLQNLNLTEKEREEIAKKSFEKQKALSKANATLNYGLAITSILGQYPKFDGGIAMAAALISATITFGVQMAKINATQYQPPDSGDKSTPTPAGSKFSSGGLLIGKSHNQGGIKTALGELEGGEFLVNRVAAEKFMPILEKINSFGQQQTERMSKEQMPVFKTYVVATDVTSAQLKQRKLEKLAQL